MHLAASERSGGCPFLRSRRASSSYRDLVRSIRSPESPLQPAPIKNRPLLRGPLLVDHPIELELIQPGVQAGLKGILHAQLSLSRQREKESGCFAFVRFIKAAFMICVVRSFLRKFRFLAEFPDVRQVGGRETERGKRAAIRDRFVSLGFYEGRNYSCAH